MRKFFSGLPRLEKVFQLESGGSNFVSHESNKWHKETVICTAKDVGETFITTSLRETGVT